jgi:hypothetical protein
VSESRSLRGRLIGGGIAEASTQRTDRSDVRVNEMAEDDSRQPAPPGESPRVRGALARVARAATGTLAVALCALAAGLSAQTGSAAIGLSPFTVEAISCPSTTLCVAVDDSGHAVSWTNPTGLTPRWRAPDIDGVVNFVAVACGSASMCLAVDSNGRAFVSTDPTAASPTWTGGPTIAGSPVGSAGISCPSSSLCVAVNPRDGTVSVSTDPAAATPIWNTQVIDAAQPNTAATLATPPAGSGYLEAVSCASSSLCVAVDSSGHALISTDPAAAATTRSAPISIDTTELTGISCPSTALCVAVDNRGDAVTLTSPTAATPKSAVSVTPEAAYIAAHDRAMLGAVWGAVSCGTEAFCVATYSAGLTGVVAGDPTIGSTGWRFVPTLLDQSVEPAVSCLQTALCVVTGFAASTDPAAANPAWRRVTIDGPPPGTATIRGAPRTRGPTLTFGLACRGESRDAFCSGSATVTVSERFSANGRTVTDVAPAATTTPASTVAIARTKFDVSADGLHTVRLTLNRAGAHLFAKFTRFAATLSVSAASSPLAQEPLPIVPVATLRVVFSAAAAPRAR